MKRGFRFVPVSGHGHRSFRPRRDRRRGPGVIATAAADVLVASMSCGLGAPETTHRLNVEIVQVRSDDGSTASPLDATSDPDHGYAYESAVNEIWAQGGIEIVYSYSVWDETDALRLSLAERDAIFDDNSGVFPSLPGIGVDTLQFFFVQDHPGTGYDPADPDNTGYIGSPLENPEFSARNSGVMELFIDTLFASNGRGVMANEGFEAASLSCTLAHEIGHGLGLRHPDDNESTDTMVEGVNVDPILDLDPETDRNLMWSGGAGAPAYDSLLDDDPELTVLQENCRLTPLQIDAAIHNGLHLDPDGNAVGVLQPLAVPLKGDMNGDGIVNGLDIEPFVLALVDPDEYLLQIGKDPILCGDINDDGQLNGLDVEPFVSLLTGGDAAPTPVRDAAGHERQDTLAGSSPAGADGGVSLTRISATPEGIEIEWSSEPGGRFEVQISETGRPASWTVAEGSPVMADRRVAVYRTTARLPRALFRVRPWSP